MVNETLKYIHLYDSRHKTEEMAEDEVKGWCIPFKLWLAVSPYPQSTIPQSLVLHYDYNTRRQHCNNLVTVKYLISV